MTDQLNTIQALQLKLAEQEQQRLRGEKIQAALYEIADAAGAVSDLQQFYAKLHGVIGELMYAGNFFIALLDSASGMLSWPYHVDEKDAETWPSKPYREDTSATSYVLRTGKSLHGASDAVALAERKELEIVGTMSEDAIFVPLRSAGKTLG